MIGLLIGFQGRNVMRKRLVMGAAALALVLAGCGGGDEGGGGGGGNGGTGEPGNEEFAGKLFTVQAQDNSFAPAELRTAPSGEIGVEIINSGENTHTFTSEEAGFDSGEIAPGDAMIVSFEAPDGPTPFQCSIHGSGGMTGEIIPQ
jgi:plastocyanin